MCNRGDLDAPNGVWVAYYSDWSGIAVFPTEIEALRHAVGNSMSVEFYAWGQIR